MKTGTPSDDINEPAIDSFEAVEIATGTAFAVQISNAESDRGIKREIHDVAARSVLNSLCG